MRAIATALWLAYVLAGCVNVAPDRIDHTVRFGNVGKTKITDLTYTYGSLGTRVVRNVGLASDSVTAPMVVPTEVPLQWTTEDGVRHEAVVPLGSRVTWGGFVASGRTISFELNGAQLKVFTYVLRDFTAQDRKQIY